MIDLLTVIKNTLRNKPFFTSVSSLQDKNKTCCWIALIVGILVHLSYITTLERFILEKQLPSAEVLTGKLFNNVIFKCISFCPKWGYHSLRDTVNITWETGFCFKVLCQRKGLSDGKVKR